MIAVMITRGLCVGLIEALECAEADSPINYGKAEEFKMRFEEVEG
jgi:hypothetical protein